MNTQKISFNSPMLRKKINYILFVALTTLGVLFWGYWAEAAPIRARQPAEMAVPALQEAPYTAQVRVFSLPAAATGGDAQARVVVGLEISLPDGHYTYAHSPDVPRPTDVQVFTPEGTPLPAEVRYPKSVEREDFFEAGKRVPAYEGRFILFIQPMKAASIAQVRFSMLVCSQKNCTPVEQEFSVPLTSPALRDLPDRMDSAVLAAWRQGVTFNTPEAPPPSLVPAVALSPDEAFTDFPPALEPRFADPGLEPSALFMALWLGLLAGLVLNVMPCVLPVLTIKLTALLGAGGSELDEAGRIRRFREHNLYFSAGIISWFALLAGAVGGLGLAWGGLFQQVSVVYGLLILVFLLGLSLFDVFTLPVLDLKLAHGSGASPRVQAYLSGLVVTLLATPCSGPLLGGVLGWAASQPLFSVVLVFLATGVGMALPYLALAIWPGVAKKFPKPGPWTGIVERLAGFFLMATALYLLSVLPETLRFSALGVLLVTALAAWIWGRWGSLASLKQQCLTGVLCVALVGGALLLSLRQPEIVPWQNFTPQTFSRELGRTPMLVEFTADWCPTCKVLERTVLTPERLADLRARYGLLLVKVDMTRPDAQAEALLRALGSVSIPVAAIFPAGDNALKPVVLRDLYTGKQLEEAVIQAIPQK